MAITVTNKDGKTITVAGAGRDGTPGKSAYQIAVDNGFQGTEQDWLDSLKCADGVGVPIGGTTGQVLAKKSDENYDTEWIDKDIDEVDLAGDKVVGVLPVEKGGTGGTIWPSNPSLLINGDFRKPVNRNGKSEYTGTGYMIDRWQQAATGRPEFTAEVLDGIGIKFTLGNARCLWKQELQNIPSSSTQKYTASLFYSDNKLLTFTSTLTDAISSGVDGLQIQFESNAVGFVINAAANNVVFIVAKLELGDQQTLAHQDADGNWVLNDPPDYDLQYLLCSQYSPSNGEFVGSQHSNQNLLDNAYWADKDYITNQRGQKEYTDAGYTIDRWQQGSNTKLVIVDDFIRYHKNNVSGNPVFLQVFDNYTIYNDVLVTLSFIYRTNNLQSGDFRAAIRQPNTTAQYLFYPQASTDWNLFMITVQANLTDVWLAQILEKASGDSYIDFKAAKLELGDQQTLAHKEGDVWVLNDPAPSPSLELLKCQRYFQVFETQSARPTKALDFRPTMRTEPTLSTITVDGKTLYTASADL